MKVPAAVRSRVAPELTTALVVVLPSADVWPTASTPELIVVDPVKVFAALSVKVPTSAELKPLITATRSR